MTVTTEHGDISIAAGANSGFINVTLTPGSDVFIDDNGNFSATVSGTSGGNFENLIGGTSATITTAISDIIDTTTLTLHNATVSEADWGAATITGSLGYTPDTELVVTLNNGATLTFSPSYVAGDNVTSTAFAFNNGEQ